MSLERIAIVGMGGVFPGAHDLAGFWRNVAQGVDSGRPAPPERWFLKPDRALAPGGPQPDRVYSTWCCPLDDTATTFDPGALPHPEVAARLDRLDPLFRIGLKSAHQAWMSAGTTSVEPQRAGVILGHIVLPTESTSAVARDELVRDFAAKLLGDRAPAWQHSKWDARNWSAAGLPAALIAGALGLRGTAFTLDAACASSLYALKLACDELRSGRADVMLAGGLSRPDCQYTQMGFAQLQALTKRGRCAPLSAAADGLVVGEGAGIFVLKRLSDALRDGDRIAATIAGIGLSNDRGANLLAPHSEGQLRAMQAAYEQAGWRPGDVDLIECHATGTPVGDAVELDSLHALWKEETGRPHRCVLGSVKSNVGHLLTGAGGASLMKMLWALQEQTLPPTANFVEPAPALRHAESPFRVLAKSERWQRRDDQTPRRAAINAFGFGGINAHVLLEEAEGLGLRVKGQKNTDAPKVSFSVSQPLALSPEPAIAIVGVAARCGSLANLDDIAARFFGYGSIAHTEITEVAMPVGEFRIPPLELEDMLPQQQLMLLVSAAALDDAQCGRDLGNRTGVFVGINLDPNTTNFHGRWSLEEFAPEWAARLGSTPSPDEMAAWVKELRDAFGPPLTANRVMGNLGGIVASRLAREFDVGGPSFTLSSDETSGVQALQVAIQALQHGELDRALVGAVDFQSDVRLSGRGSRVESREPAGDAAVAFILKRHDDAVRDGDRIYAIVANVISSCPASEDPATPRALTMTSNRVESDIGDCGAATGLLACLKSTLSLHHRVLPSTTPGDPHGAQPWLQDRDRGPRTSTTSVLAKDGTRVAITLREAAASKTAPALPAGIFVFEGETEKEVLSALEECQSLMTDEMMHHAARRWFHRRRPNPQRTLAAVIIAASSQEWHTAAENLRTTLSSSDRPTTNDQRPTLFIREPLGPTGHVAFVFPGSGNHFLGMGKELFAAFPQVLHRQDEESDRLASQYQPDLIWNGPSTDAIGRNHKAMIFGQVALGTAVCDWLTLFGVRPTAAIGYSLGESAALFGLRAWTDRDDMLQRMEAATLFGSDLVKPFNAARKIWNVPADQDVPWLSGVIDRSAGQVRESLAKYPRVYLLIVNSPMQCVIGGDRTQLDALVRELGATFVPFPAPSTVHCELLQPVSDAYVSLHTMRTTPPAGITFYSGATGLPYTLDADSAAAAIHAQARETVDFPRVIERAYADGVRLFVEIGPGSSCTRMIDDILGERPHWVRPVLPATADPVTHALRVLGELITHRVPVDLTALYGDEPPVEKSAARCVVTKTSLPDWQLAPLAKRANSMPPTGIVMRAPIAERPKESVPVPLRAPAVSRSVQNDPAPAAWNPTASLSREGVAPAVPLRG
ncbi:MAG TPA: beta-ketoacyl synthase N-terminal-like domain-containing protein, partial [Planctomycetaceae bacterium]|nr:beta-ketoacyl synthase N-terminal-like domain-containing protein [Planctomycetaceae bacterium]